MNKLEKGMKEAENFYYNQLEWHRVFGAIIEQIENELNAQLGVEIDFMFLYPDKKLVHNLFSTNLTATEIYSVLEMLTDDIKLEKNSDHNEVTFKAEIKGFEVILILYVGINKRCWYEEVGTKEVPVYELRCEENE